MSEGEKFRFEELDFGTVLNEIIAIDTVTDIEIREREIWIVDINKGRYRYDLSGFTEEEQEEFYSNVRKMPNKIAIRMHVPFNEGNPILDGEYLYKNEGQLRINAIHESLTDSDYQGIAIRKTRYGLRINEENILEDYTTQEFLNLMQVLLYSGCNVMIAGLTGAGKTELLRFLARYINDNEAIITIEDTYEAYLKRIYPQKEVLALKSTKEKNFSDLIRTSLRQNPDWIAVSETRGKEVVELMEAVGTGHHLISTIHADSSENIPARMIDMAKVDGMEATRMNRQIHQNINIGIYIYYYNDENGSHRMISEVSEFYIDETGEPKSHLLYYYDYEKNTFCYEKVRSRQIWAKVRRAKADLDNAKEFFYD